MNLISSMLFGKRVAGVTCPAEAGEVRIRAAREARPGKCLESSSRTMAVIDRRSRAAHWRNTVYVGSSIWIRILRMSTPQARIAQA
jgi:hypothetical protein